MVKIPPIEIGIDLQTYHDDLVAYRNALTAHIEALERSGRVCTHQRVAAENAIAADGLLRAPCTDCGHWVVVGQV